MHTVDLFSGCGGLSLGAHFAGLRTAVAVDVDATLSSSFSTNFPATRLINANAAEIDVRPHLSDLGVKHVTAVIGGPPCQGFSLMGRRDPKDPRNLLLKTFFKRVSEIQPTFFVMENVPGLLSTGTEHVLQEALSELRGPYKLLKPMILNAAEFGAATSRQRAVVIGYLPKYMDGIDPRDFSGGLAATTVREAISDLPNVRANFADDFRKLPSGRQPSSYAKRMTKGPPIGLATPDARKRFKEGMVSGFNPTEHSPAVVARFRATKPGSTEPVSRYARLHWDAPAPVLRAGTGSEKGSYQAARPIHPKYNRVITVREAARLQGFPDWFQFHPTKWHSHRMIGNSVSPIFAEAVLRILISRCQKNLSVAA